MTTMGNAMKFAASLGLVTVAIALPAFADYKFSVKVKNNTNHMLTNVVAYWKAKGSSDYKTCWSGSESIKKKKAIQLRCESAAKSKKWQRRIRVYFDCPNYLVSGSNPAGWKEKYFPASNRHFARDHAVNKKDTYTVEIKKGDCSLPPIN
tara:strand:+ start:1391 stop:1840 length:450 start_codon:yes stop_codon:yes gene_type:complete